MTHNLDADLTKAVASIIQTARDLKDADSGLRVELANLAASVQVERTITRDLVEAVHKRMDVYEAKLERAVVALERLANRG